MRAIRAKAHGWNPPGDEPFSNVSQSKLVTMEHEGIKGSLDEHIGRTIKHLRRKHKLTRKLGG
jgi:hypothetical protein